jgi:hypothetical protein
MVHGTLDAEDPQRIDGAYFFNPFSLPVVLPGLRCELPEDRFASRAAADVVVAETFLHAARPGVRIVTFGGFGGTFPAQYARLAWEPWDGIFLELWEKQPIGTGATI